MPIPCPALKTRERRVARRIFGAYKISRKGVIFRTSRHERRKIPHANAVTVEIHVAGDADDGALARVRFGARSRERARPRSQPRRRPYLLLPSRRRARARVAVEYIVVFMHPFDEPSSSSRARARPRLVFLHSRPERVFVPALFVFVSFILFLSSFVAFSCRRHHRRRSIRRPMSIGI